MSPLMLTKPLSILPVCLLLGVLCVAVSASPDDEQVASYLKAHNMLSLLEVQLQDRMSHADDQAHRDELGEELAQLYLDRLRSFDADDPYRQIILNRANDFVSSISSTPMYALRIELAIESYIAIEPRVELARLDLLDPEDRTDAIARFSEIARTLDVLTTKLDPAVTILERSGSRSNRGDDERHIELLTELRRNRSLAHYYEAWTGYSLAVLKNQHVSREVMISFGWLLGSKGEMPQFSSMNESTLEFEHVARAAIGLAMAYGQSEDTLTARSWALYVVESKSTDPESVQLAQDRLLELMAMDRDWTDTLRWALTLLRERGEDIPMRVADARFLALRSLAAMQSPRVGRGGTVEATKVARMAIEQLVNQGEIGHVLDLYQRFDSLPLMADSFITLYARALGELKTAEDAGASGRFASVGTLFAQALEAKDADRFPNERDDGTLKLAYVEIRANRPSEALKVCSTLIERSPKAKVIEEARWMRIAALEAINNKAGDTDSDQLSEAVRQYIVAYPSTARSARLILRHAMQGTIDAGVAINTLAEIGDDDPIVLPARRTLVGLRYKQLRASGFADELLRSQTLDMIRWIIEHTPATIADLDDARAQMGTIRIGLDLALRSTPPEIELGDELVAGGMSLLSFDASLGVYRAELVYRQLEIAIAEHRAGDAEDLLSELDAIDPAKGDSARVLIFNDSIRSWQARKSKKIAARLIKLGSIVLSKQTPPYPEPLGIQGSSVAEAIAQAGEYLWENSNDTSARDLALRVSLMVLDRGQPSEFGLRRTVNLARSVGDQTNELDAWLRLLAAYPTSSVRWYESRYESFRLMFRSDPDRAHSAYNQFKVLHPTLGPAPWNAKIAALFSEPVPAQVTKPGGMP